LLEGAVTVPTATVDKVAPAGVVTPAATLAGVAVPTTSAAAVVLAPAAVENTTCGTVTAVLSTLVVDEPETIVPDVEHGTTSVVKTWIVVTGTV